MAIVVIVVRPFNDYVARKQIINGKILARAYLHPAREYSEVVICLVHGHVALLTFCQYFRITCSVRISCPYKRQTDICLLITLRVFHFLLCCSSDLFVVIAAEVASLLIGDRFFTVCESIVVGDPDSPVDSRHRLAARLDCEFLVESYLDAVFGMSVHSVAETAGRKQVKSQFIPDLAQIVIVCIYTVSILILRPFIGSRNNYTDFYLFDLALGMNYARWGKLFTDLIRTRSFDS